MAKYSGKDFIIQRQTSVGPPATYTTIAGMRATSMTVNNEQVDVTDKGDAPWKQLLAVGVRSMQMSCSGVFRDDAVMASLMGDVSAGSIVIFKLTSGRGDSFLGSFLVTSMQRDGSYNGAEQYSLTLDSAGTIAYTPSA